jgi:hypothetical protein
VGEQIYDPPWHVDEEVYEEVLYASSIRYVVDAWSVDDLILNSFVSSCSIQARDSAIDQETNMNTILLNSSECMVRDDEANQVGSIVG